MVNTLEIKEKQLEEYEKITQIFEKRAKENQQNNQPQDINQDINQELLSTLKAIKKNQDIDRKRYERNHAIEGDEPVHDWVEIEVEDGAVGTFTYNIPEGHVFYWQYPSISWYDNSTYYVYIDGALEPTLSEVVQDMGDHKNVFIPPKKCYAKAELRVLNNDGETHNYAAFFGGFLRRYTKIDEIRSSEL